MRDRHGCMAVKAENISNRTERATAGRPTTMAPDLAWLAVIVFPLHDQARWRVPTSSRSSRQARLRGMALTSAYCILHVSQHPPRQEPNYLGEHHAARQKRLMLCQTRLRVLRHTVLFPPSLFPPRAPTLPSSCLMMY